MVLQNQKRILSYSSCEHQQHHYVAECCLKEGRVISVLNQLDLIKKTANPSGSLNSLLPTVVLKLT